MSQSYSDVPASTTLKDSLPLLLGRDDAVKSHFSGTAFPSSGLVVGMMCYRTDQKILYMLTALTPTWQEILDLSSAFTIAPKADALTTPRTITIGGAVSGSVSFDGSGDVTITTTRQSIVTAGTYTKVTVGTGGQVTAGASLVNADLPDPLSRPVIRTTATATMTLSSTDHGFQVGVDTAIHIAMDRNHIQARNNGSAGSLNINTLGGNLNFGDGVSSVLTLDGNLSSASLVLATQAEAEAQSTNSKLMSPGRTKQLIDARSFTSTNQTITSAGALTLAHGLGIEPKHVSLALVCITAEAGYVNGDVVIVGPNQSLSGSSRVNGIYVDATNVYVRYSDQTNCFIVANKTTGVATAVTNGNWRLRVKATA